MNNKAPEKKTKDLWDLYLAEQRERMKGGIYYWGCMGAIVFFTLLLRWVVGIFKGF